MRRFLTALLLAAPLLAACGHARDEAQADPGAWSRQMPDLLRQTAETRGIVACWNKRPKTAEGERPCAPLEILPDDKLYVTTAIKQQRDEPDGGWELNFYRDVWMFCFIDVRGETSTEYLADFRRGAVGPDLNTLGDTPPSGPAKVVITMSEGYLDGDAKIACDWLWNFTTTPQRG